MSRIRWHGERRETDSDKVIDRKLLKVLEFVFSLVETVVDLDVVVCDNKFQECHMRFRFIFGLVACEIAQVNNQVDNSGDQVCSLYCLLLLFLLQVYYRSSGN